MERRNVTIGGNVTEVQEFVTYDITQLRMDPVYIRSKKYIVNLHYESRDVLEIPYRAITIGSVKKTILP